MVEILRRVPAVGMQNGAWDDNVHVVAGGFGAA